MSPFPCPPLWTSQIRADNVRNVHCESLQVSKEMEKNNLKRNEDEGEDRMRIICVCISRLLSLISYTHLQLSPATIGVIAGASTIPRNSKKGCPTREHF
jgi:hypothetical protein